VLLPNLDRIRLSHVRLHDRLGTPTLRRTCAVGDRQFGRDVALCGRRGRFALVVDRSDLGTLASGSSDPAPCVDLCLSMVGSRRTRLATQDYLGTVITKQHLTPPIRGGLEK